MWAGITDLPATVGGRILRVSLLSLAVAVLLALSLGTMTYRISGRAGLAAMAAALLISLVSNVAGTLPACWYLSRPGPPCAKNVLSGMVVRLVVLVVLAVPTVLSGLLPQRPLLLWLAGGYFVLLMVETTLVAKWLNQHHRVQSS